MFIIVDLPEPDGPMMAMNSPLATCRFTSTSAGTWTLPEVVDTADVFELDDRLDGMGAHALIARTAPPPNPPPPVSPPRLTPPPVVVVVVRVLVVPTTTTSPWLKPPVICGHRCGHQPDLDGAGRDAAVAALDLDVVAGGGRALSAVAGTRSVFATDAVVTVTVALIPASTVAGGLVRVTVTAYVTTLLEPPEVERHRHDLGQGAGHDHAGRRHADRGRLADLEVGDVRLGEARRGDHRRNGLLDGVAGRGVDARQDVDRDDQPVGRAREIVAAVTAGLSGVDRGLGRGHLGLVGRGSSRRRSGRACSGTGAWPRSAAAKRW